jgi:hypothetical protein
MLPPRRPPYAAASRVAKCAADLRSSNPQLDDEAPLVVLATQPVDDAEQAMLAAARAFLEG